LPSETGGDGSADLKYVLGVADSLGPLLKDYTVIVDKSTVPFGTAEKVHQRIATHAKVDFDVVSNPEFLREGVAVEDFMKPDRIVIGTVSDRAKKLLEQLGLRVTRLIRIRYGPFQLGKLAQGAVEEVPFRTLPNLLSGYFARELTEGVIWQ